MIKSLDFAISKQNLSHILKSDRTNHCLEFKIKRINLIEDSFQKISREHLSMTVKSWWSGLNIINISKSWKKFTIMILNSLSFKGTLLVWSHILQEEGDCTTNKNLCQTVQENSIKKFKKSWILTRIVAI